MLFLANTFPYFDLCFQLCYSQCAIFPSFLPLCTAEIAQPNSFHINSSKKRISIEKEIHKDQNSFTMPLMTFSEITESEKKVFGGFWSFFYCFQIILSRDLKDVLWRKVVTNLSQLYFMGLEPNRGNTTIQIV